MEQDNKPTPQTIINARQVIIGDKNKIQSDTNDKGADLKPQNTTRDVVIDTNDSKNHQPPAPNKDKIGKIIAAIATFCSISGISAFTIWTIICSDGCSSNSSIVTESSETNISISSDPLESNLSETDEDSKMDDSSGIVRSDTESSESSSKVEIASKPIIPSVPTGSPGSTPITDYKIYLYSEYSKITIYGENNMTATLNFEADEVRITAYLASGKADTLIMNRKNPTEWGKKVVFNETGIHKIVATAVAPDGKTIEGITEIEVIPINLGDYNFDQLFPFT